MTCTQVAKEKMDSMKAERDALAADVKQLLTELNSQRDDSSEVHSQSVTV